MFLFSYPASLFRQLHSFLSATLKSTLRIHFGGLLIIKFIVKIDDVNSLITIVVHLFVHYYIYLPKI